MRRIDSKKRGITLVEVALSMVIIGIIAVSVSSYFFHAARSRAGARATQAGLIQANALMERAFYSVTEAHYDSGSGYLDPASNMDHSSGNVTGTWTFDGDSTLLTEVEFIPDANNVAQIIVTVETPSGRPVVLTAYRYCGD